MQRKTILMLFGGESTEHEVSINSARNVRESIDESKFDLILCYIDRQGKWWLVDEINVDFKLNNDRMLTPVLGESHFICTLDNSKVTPDAILPILHGKNGEDGVVQALASLMHIPIVGSDMASSSLAIDKITSKQVVAASNIPIVDYVVHRSYEKAPNYSDLTKSLGNILFIKPASQGSSVGVSKVHSESELADAIKLAHENDDVILIETAIDARELEVAVLGNTPNLQVSGVGEIKPNAEFYSYESKYDGSSKSQAIIPADISDDVQLKVREYAGEIFKLLGCSGLARVDFFLNESGEIYFNEINTIPGFTNISMYPKLLVADGMPYPEIISSLINLALEPVTIRL